MCNRYGRHYTFTEEEIHRCGQHLDAVPGDQQTESMCAGAVSNDGFALSSVARRLRTRELCLMAVSKEPAAIDSVPQEFIDEEMAELALRGYFKHLNLTYIKDKTVISEETFRRLIKERPSNILLHNDPSIELVRYAASVDPNIWDQLDKIVVDGLDSQEGRMPWHPKLR